MTITKAEILEELRELVAAVQIVGITKATMGKQYVTEAQWKSLRKSWDHAAKLIEQIDGPKIETGCICYKTTPGTSMMGMPCKLHGTQGRHE